MGLKNDANVRKKIGTDKKNTVFLARGTRKETDKKTRHSLPQG